MEIPIPPIEEVIPTIKVASFNIQNSKDSEFIDTVTEEMKVLDVDIVAIQGCTKLNSESLFRSFKQRGYQYTRFDQMHTRSSSEIMFYSSRVTIKKKEYTKFGNSLQQRGVAKYKVSIGKTDTPEVWVITSQLEEGGSGNGYRKSQILEMGTMFSSSPISVIFAGDTSIPSWQTLREPSGWRDGWREKGTSENEKTTLLDGMDKIWYANGGDRRIECINYSLVCTFCNQRKGVMATFEL